MILRYFRNILYSFFILNFGLLISVSAAEAPKPDRDVAVFAGGCFWCMQPPFDKLKNKGVISTQVGYTGGTKVNPTYEDVSSGQTGHIEAIEVTFNPKLISYRDLLKVFWRNVDPFDPKGQFCDTGEEYISAVFYSNEMQKRDFESSIVDLEKQGIKKEKIVTSLRKAMKFYPAEEDHQSYYVKNPIRYTIYRGNCGRDKRLKEVWGASHKE